MATALLDAGGDDRARFIEHEEDERFAFQALGDRRAGIELSPLVQVPELPPGFGHPAAGRGYLGG